MPLTIIFGAAAFRLSWNIPYSIATVSKGLLGLAIGATVGGYFFLLCLLIRPSQTKKLKPQTMRIGAIAGVTAALSVATAYLIQNISVSIATISKVVLGLSIAVVVAGYFSLLLLIRLGLMERLKTQTVRRGVTIVVTIALVNLTIHTIRFMPSPEAALLQSKIMAILLLAATAAAHPVILRYIWSVWRREERS